MVLYLRFYILKESRAEEPIPSAPSRGKGNGSKEYISPSLAASKHNREKSVKGAFGTACGGSGP